MYKSNITIRRAEDGSWGFVEAFKFYRYDEKGSISVICGIGSDGKFCKPYVMRSSKFVPLEQIDAELGVEKYINAKKPFYSLLQDGFIAQVKAGLNYETGELIEKTSNFTLYKVDSKKLVSDSEGILNISRVLRVPESIEPIIHSLQEDLATCRGNREDFLKSRF